MEEKTISEREEKQKRVIDLMEENRILDSKITRLKELEKDNNVKGE